MEEIESWNPVSENIYFWAHTLTNFYSKSWNGKNKVQTTSKMIFTDLNSLFDKKLYALMYRYIRVETVWIFPLGIAKTEEQLHLGKYVSDENS